jgi:hypothetical protein
MVMTISVKKFLTVLTDKISIDPMQFRPSVKIHFPVEFQVISNMLLFYLFIGPTVDVTNGLRLHR